MKKKSGVEAEVVHRSHLKRFKAICDVIKQADPKSGLLLFKIQQNKGKQISLFSILAFRNTLRHQRLVWKGQISNFRVDIEFLMMTERCTVHATRSLPVMN